MLLLDEDVILGLTMLWSKDRRSTRGDPLGGVAVDVIADGFVTLNPTEAVGSTWWRHVLSREEVEPGVTTALEHKPACILIRNMAKEMGKSKGYRLEAKDHAWVTYMGRLLTAAPL